MGNILSNDEKLSQLFPSYDKKSRRILWIDEHFGYRPANKSQGKGFNRKRTIYYDRNKERTARRRSHSLSAYTGDLYAYEQYLGGSYQNLNRDKSFKISKSFLPRIKLVKGTNTRLDPIEDFHYISQRDMYNCSDGRYSISDNPTTSYEDGITLLEKEETKTRLPQTRSYHENERTCVIIDKPEDSYFMGNFDECMKTLQLIEKDHEIMGKDGGRNVNAYNFKKHYKRQIASSVDHVFPPPSQPDKCSLINGKYRIESEEISTTKQATSEDITFCDEIQNVNIVKDFEEAQDGKSSFTESSHNDRTKGWYSNLKKQFETVNQESKLKETSCRVMGATLKDPKVSMLTSKGEGKDVKHYFSRLVRSNKSLIDEELPDPDKVQNIRAMFQETLNSTLGKGLNKGFGGSLQNISCRPRADELARPKSAQATRNDYAGYFRKLKENGKISKRTGIHKSENSSLNPDSNVNSMNGFKTADTEREKISKRKCLLTKWTDTASLSSGVSSDLSCCDTEVECCSREDEQNSTDDEFQDMEDKHYVQSETLEKIRSFGTSVTYFGGQMITCSVGPLLSPTTQAILEEIGEKYNDRKNFTRTFEEFYKKYTENNEPRLKKLGRTRSFGQSDVFHKPNTLSNSEIDIYKNDLEMEIGIRKPSGKVQSTLKQKLVKLRSIGSRLELCERDVVDKLNELLEATIEMTITPRTKEEKDVNEQEHGRENSSASEKMVQMKGNGENKNEELCIFKKDPEDEKYKKILEDTQARNIHSRQFLFGYEKHAFDRERKPDMDFEEFEVCQTVEEKMEKIDENPQSFRLTIHVNQEAAEEDETIEEIIINEQEPLDSLEIYLKTRKSEDSSNGKLKRENDSGPKIHENSIERSLEISSTDQGSLTNCCPAKPEISTTSVGDLFEKHFPTTVMYTSSKWPIETTVMFDIQKNEQNSPKLLTPAKSSVKIETRAFKK